LLDQFCCHLIRRSAGAPLRARDSTRDPPSRSIPGKAAFLRDGFIHWGMERIVVTCHHQPMKVTAMKILHLDSSALGANSVSRSLTAEVVSELRRVDPSAQVRYRDLAAMVLPAVTEGLLHGMRRFPNQTEQPELTPALRSEVDAAQELLDELLEADTVVIGAPMYNFSIPQPLKAWIDRVVMPGRTFRYTEKGPEGLAGDRRVIVVSTRGSKMSGAPYEVALDHQEAYLLAVLGFIGIKDVKFVRAEGLAMSAHRDESIASAKVHAAQLANELA